MKKSLEHHPNAEEIIDNVNLSIKDMSAVESALNRVNYFSGNFFRIAQWLSEEYLKAPNKEFTFADIGCGGGGLLRYLKSFAERNNLKVNFHGIDTNQALISIAKSYNTESAQISYSNNRLELTEHTYSLINTNLMLHHILPEEIQPFLKLTKERASVGVRHEDLLRSRRGLFLASSFPKLISRSNIVHHDAKVSIYRSYSRQEWKEIAEECGYKFKTVFPERVLLKSCVL